MPLPRRAPAHLRALAPLVVLALTAAGCGGLPGTGKDGAAVGTLITTSDAAQGSPVSVKTPDGDYTFTVTHPQHDLPAYDETFDHAVDGASLVGVSWSWDFAAAHRAMLDPDAPDVEPSFDLVADGRSYSLDDAMLTRLAALHDPSGATGGSDAPVVYSGTVWVAVAGEPRDLAVSVDFDGLTQTVGVDDLGFAVGRGAAQALYLPDSMSFGTRTACPAPVVDDPGLRPDDASCQVTVSQVPYRQGVGWAADGHAWTVVDLQAAPGSSIGNRDFSRTYFFDDDARPTSSSRLDGARPVLDTAAGGAPRGVLDYALDTTLVFDTEEVAEPATLVVRGSFAATTSPGSSGPPTTSIDLTWRVPVSG